ncbi:ChaN family lipoprotein [Pseudooceanicola aestuarii]|uniref:ChaN family lipoprotein n=1 Tax=Pseudooceanicola aestuarii TaxID=2697319 RepID=UPI0013D047E3|nr:ChaN family lipoprotein [Pseudooceanicola aestuarii]
MSARPWYSPATGAPLSHVGALDILAQAPIVLLGEQHDIAAIHRWQLHVAAGLLARRPLVLGFEMFPARLDPVLAEWVDGRLDEDTFLARAEWNKVWGFPAELYLPLFRFCRETGTAMVGLNCRRDLVREVGRDGWAAIPEDAREGLTPAAPSPRAYRDDLFRMVAGSGAARGAVDGRDPAFDRFVRAQEVWDRAFATRLATATDHPGAPQVVGIIGQGHLHWGGGVSHQLASLGHPGSCVAVPRPRSAASLPAGAADLVALLPD